MFIGKLLSHYHLCEDQLLQNGRLFLCNLKDQQTILSFADPDALTNTGTYDTDYLISDPRINDDSETLSFSGSTVTAATSGTFDNVIAGDFIHITGATKPENNGTFKITTKTSGTIVVTDGVFTTESSTAGCARYDKISKVQKPYP